MATVVDFCCKGPGLLSAVPMKHSRIAVIDDGDLRTKIIISKKLPDVKIIERKDVNILKTMKDLNVIMNPPYDGSLHLKILDSVINTFPEAKIVSLQPANQIFSCERLFNEHAFITAHKELTQHIQDVDLIKAEKASELFNTAFAGPLMIIYYDLTKEGKNIKDFNIIKPELRSIVEKTVQAVWNKKYKSLQDAIKTKYTPNKYYLTCPEVHGNQGKRDWAEITSSNYETALKSKQRFGWHLEFDTEEERLNCWKSWHLKSHMFIHSLVKSDNFNRYKNLPYLDDYTHEWTDEMLYEYFELTEDEIKEIEKEVNYRGV